jgi:hypothetical protein
VSQTIIRVYEGDPLPDHVQSPRILATEEVPTGTGTATRRQLTLLVHDGRYWLSDDEKRATPLGTA